MAMKFTISYLEDSVALFRYYKKLADGAIAQVTDEQLATVLDSEANSITINRQAHGWQHAFALDGFSDQ